MSRQKCARKERLRPMPTWIGPHAAYEGTTTTILMSLRQLVSYHITSRRTMPRWRWIGRMRTQLLRIVTTTTILMNRYYHTARGLQGMYVPCRELRVCVITTRETCKAIKQNIVSVKKGIFHYFGGCQQGENNIPPSWKPKKESGKQGTE